MPLHAIVAVYIKNKCPSSVSQSRERSKKVGHSFILINGIKKAFSYTEIVLQSLLWGQWQPANPGSLYRVRYYILWYGTIYWGLKNTQI